MMYFASLGIIEIDVSECLYNTSHSLISLILMLYSLPTLKLLASGTVIVTTGSNLRLTSDCTKTKAPVLKYMLSVAISAVQNGLSKFKLSKSA